MKCAFDYSRHIKNNEILRGTRGRLFTQTQNAMGDGFSVKPT